MKKSSKCVFLIQQLNSLLLPIQSITDRNQVHFSSFEEQILPIMPSDLLMLLLINLTYLNLTLLPKPSKRKVAQPLRIQFTLDSIYMVILKAFAAVASLSVSVFEIYRYIGSYVASSPTNTALPIFVRIIPRH